jgi:selenocysteine lyase/cysteine desulfurase
MLNPEEYRHLFPHTKLCTFLDHAAVPPQPTPVREAVYESIAEDELRQEVRWQKWMERKKKGLNLISTMINASPEEILFTGNTTRGFIILANGIDWHKGDNIVTTEGEFPANVVPWMLLKRLGVETRFAPHRDGRLLIEDIENLIDERTRLVTVSFVYWLTGFRSNLKALGELCRKKGIYLAVDGAQGVGAIPIDVQESRIDFLTTCGFKWLLGPVGSGFFYCRKEIVPKLAPSLTGYSGAISEGGSYMHPPTRVEPLNDARRFDDGSPNVPCIYGLTASVELLTSVGIDRIERHLMNLTSHLIDGLEDLGYDLITPHDREEERSGIVCFKHDRLSLKEIFERLRASKVMVSLKEGFCIRVSPHFYNNDKDIERFLEALP